MLNQIRSRFHSAVVALVFVAIPLAGFSQSSSEPERVWYWFADCNGGKMMGVEVFIDGASIYHSEFLACLRDRNGATSNSQRRIEFHIPGGRTFQGRYRTNKAETIEGTLWQAGADPDAMLLGLSFATKDQVLLNSIHIADPAKSTESTVDPGIVVKTRPLSAATIPSN
jgi:hypothetical protein